MECVIVNLMCADVTEGKTDSIYFSGSSSLEFNTDGHTNIVGDGAYAYDAQPKDLSDLANRVQRVIPAIQRIMGKSSGIAGNRFHGPCRLVIRFALHSTPDGQLKIRNHIVSSTQLYEAIAPLLTMWNQTPQQLDTPDWQIPIVIANACDQAVGTWVQSVASLSSECRHVLYMCKKPVIHATSMQNFGSILRNVTNYLWRHLPIENLIRQAVMGSTECEQPVVVFCDGNNKYECIELDRGKNNQWLGLPRMQDDGSWWISDEMSRSLRGESSTIAQSSTGSGSCGSSFALPTSAAAAASTSTFGGASTPSTPTPNSKRKKEVEKAEYATPATVTSTAFDVIATWSTDEDALPYFVVGKEYALCEAVTAFNAFCASLTFVTQRHGAQKYDAAIHKYTEVSRCAFVKNIWPRVWTLDEGNPNLGTFQLLPAKDRVSKADFVKQQAEYLAKYEKRGKKQKIADAHAKEEQSEAEKLIAQQKNKEDEMTDE